MKNCPHVEAEYESFKSCLKKKLKLMVDDIKSIKFFKNFHDGVA